MREFCLTDEVLQQFVDDELSPERMEMAATHLASCAACAGALTEVEQENALLVEAFAPELALPVPSAVLRERLDAAITSSAPAPRREASESVGSRVRSWFGALTASVAFTPQRSLAFASFAVVVIFASIFAVIQLRHKQDAATTVAVNIGTEQAIQPPPDAATPDGAQPVLAPASTPEIKKTSGNQAGPKVAVKKSRGTTANSGTQIATPKAIEPKTVEPKLLPGEKSYLEAIASLRTAIEENDEQTLKPTVRADFERNLAVVDQAIASTRMEAKRNPNNRDAVEFMYTAYQNKIELLSAVADQSRIASR